MDYLMHLIGIFIDMIDLDLNRKEVSKTGKARLTCHTDT